MCTDEMQAGRELDAIIAEKVLGIAVEWNYATIDRDDVVYVSDTPNSDRRWEPCYKYIPDVPGPATFWYLVPPYSTDIAAAWQVVDKLRLEHLCCLTLKADYHYVWDIEWSLAPKRWDEDVPHTKHSLGYAIESLPLGICRAALKAVQ